LPEGSKHYHRIIGLQGRDAGRRSGLFSFENDAQMGIILPEKNLQISALLPNGVRDTLLCVSEFNKLANAITAIT
jgi:hypothetical protein